MLVPMKFKSFVWPRNPRLFEVEYARALRQYRIPLSDKWNLQDIGRDARIIRGEGEFTGETAYDDFKQLADLFNEGGAGILFHPIWNTFTARLSRLTLKEEPGENILSYRFEFVEAPYDSTLSDDSAVYAHAQVAAGRTRYVEADDNESVYSFAAMNDLTVAELLALNPWIEDPDVRLREGQLLKVERGALWSQ